MAYEGDVLLSCPNDIDFSNAWAVVVSGASWNPAGHMLFCCGSNSSNGRYFHAGAGQGMSELYGAYTWPKFMSEAGYQQYLSENSKTEIRRLNVGISNPSGSYQELMSLMSGKWAWLVIPHNCVVFARNVIQAGGGDISVLLNLPITAYEPEIDPSGAPDAGAPGGAPGGDNPDAGN